MTSNEKVICIDEERFRELMQKIDLILQELAELREIRDVISEFVRVENRRSLVEIMKLVTG